MLFNQRIVNLAAAAESETDSLTEAVAEYGSMAGLGEERESSPLYCTYSAHKTFQFQDINWGDIADTKL